MGHELLVYTLYGYGIPQHCVANEKFVQFSCDYCFKLKYDAIIELTLKVIQLFKAASINFIITEMK